MRRRPTRAASLIVYKRPRPSRGYIGVLLTLKAPTREMKTEAAAAGNWRSERWQRSYPRIQLISAADIFNGKKSRCVPPFAKAAKEQISEGEQKELEL